MGYFGKKLRFTGASPGDERLDLSRLRTGATFARAGDQHVVETARILSVEDDTTGVPHVRYHCRLLRANRLFDDGPRTLAAPTFLERFRAIA